MKTRAIKFDLAKAKELRVGNKIADTKYQSKGIGKTWTIVDIKENKSGGGYQIQLIDDNKNIGFYNTAEDGEEANYCVIDESHATNLATHKTTQIDGKKTSEPGAKTGKWQLLNKDLERLVLRFKIMPYFLVHRGHFVWAAMQEKAIDGTSKADAIDTAVIPQALFISLPSQASLGNHFGGVSSEEQIAQWEPWTIRCHGNMLVCMVYEDRNTAWMALEIAWERLSPEIKELCLKWRK